MESTSQRLDLKYTYDWCVVLLFLLSKVFELMEVIMQDNHQAGSARNPRLR
jgi:hypothetical protein